MVLKLSKWNKKFSAAITCVLFVLILAVGLINGRHYGVDIDQISEEEILFMNLRPYALLFFGEESEYTKRLGESDVTTSIERDHGTAPLYITAPFAVSQNFRSDSTKWLNAYRACLFFIFWLGLICIYRLLNSLTHSKLWGWVGLCMMWLNPRFFAESTYNSKDTIAAACVLISLYFGYRLFVGGEKEYVTPILFGISSAFSTNVRFTGLIVFGLMGLIYIFRFFRGDKMNRNFLIRGLLAIFSFALLFYLITPAMWHGNVVSYIKYVFVESTHFPRWANYILAGGQLFHPLKNPIPWWYAPSYMAVTIPPFFLIVILLGFVMVFANLLRKDGRKKEDFFVFASFLYPIIVLCTVIFLKTNMYNAWRHLYSLYGPMIVCAVYGVYSLADIIKEKYGLYFRVGFASLFLIQIIFSVGFILANHPFEFSYFNVFAGKEAEKNWDADYWGVASKALLEEMYERFGACSVSNYEEIFLLQALSYVDTDVYYNVAVTEFPDSNYIALNSLYTEYVLRSETEDWVEADESVLEKYKSLMATEPLFEIKSGNCVLWSVYENE